MHVITPGVGLDSVKIKETTYQDILQYYGDSYKVDIFFTKPIICPSSLDDTVPVTDYVDKF